MCIALLSTAHPTYSLILIDNRDEYLNRPTARATWWPEQPHVLGGRDLHRSVQGTWLGVTKTGKIAVLTNFREDTPPNPDAVSRGAIIRKFLTDDDDDDGNNTTSRFVQDVVNTGFARDAGGFSLVCGRVGEKLAVISNRASDPTQVPWICGDVVQTVGLSNAAFLDHSWPKVIDGEERMLDTIRQSIQNNASEDELITQLLALLSTDTLKRTQHGTGEDMTTYIKEMRNTIFIPALGRTDDVQLRGDEWAAAEKPEEAEVLDGQLGTGQQQRELGVSGLYGTQKQTVVLVDHDMNVRFFERTLYDDVPNPVPIGSGDVDIKFRIDGSG